MAYSNFSGALFHVGGQNVFYNVCFSTLSITCRVENVVSQALHAPTDESDDVPSMDHRTNILCGVDHG